jgi:hypothetical protein
MSFQIEELREKMTTNRVFECARSSNESTEEGRKEEEKVFIPQ